MFFGNKNKIKKLENKVNELKTENSKLQEQVNLLSIPLEVDCNLSNKCNGKKKTNDLYKNNYEYTDGFYTRNEFNKFISFLLKVQSSAHLCNERTNSNAVCYKEGKGFIVKSCFKNENNRLKTAKAVRSKIRLILDNEAELTYRDKCKYDVFTLNINSDNTDNAEILLNFAQRCENERNKKGKTMAYILVQDDISSTDIKVYRFYKKSN